jgi:WD40 repeat protein
VFGASVSPDGKMAITSGRDKKIRVWNIADAKEVRSIAGFGDEVFGIAVAADGRVFSSSADKTARVNTLADGKEVLKFSEHKDSVYSVAFSAAGNRAASGAFDGEIRVWNVADGKTASNFVAAPGFKAPEASAAVAK